jgi:hypothetical protein
MKAKKRPREDEIKKGERELEKTKFFKGHCFFVHVFNL